MYNDQNKLDDDVPLGYWSTLEMCFAIVISCMPAMRLFVLHFFPKLDKDDSSGTPSKPVSAYNSSGSRGPHFHSSKKSARPTDIGYIQDNTSAYELLEVNNDLRTVKGS